MLVLIVFLGVYPKPMIERMEPSVEALIEHIELHVPEWDEPAADQLGPAEDDHSDEEGEDN